MFQKARLKLTAWYLLIIMLVSFCFSTVIYSVLGAEVDRFARVQQLRTEHRLRPEIFLNPESPMPIDPLTPIEFDYDLVREVKQHLLLNLLFVNSGILIVSGLFGYVLAGRTLKPIQEMLDEQNRFISDSSHELRTPLTSLKSTLEVNLRDKHLSIKDARILISESIDEVNKLQSLSDELLQLAQYQKPNGHAKFEPVSLPKALDDSIHHLKSLSTSKSINIINQAGDFTLEADKYSLGDLFIILLDNAIKYSQPSKTVIITTRKVDGYINVYFKDHGAGIATKDLPHIFDRFYRADTARTSANHNGYGLGLSIAKKIVEIHRGTITVDSVLGKGSTFIVHLPLKHIVKPT
jgi:two-component system sensor histidine kinase CiaH